jgi:hypothetical protein
MNPDEIAKSVVREKGLCGEVFIDDRGVKVICIETCERHHAEVAQLRARQVVLEHVAKVAREIEQSLIHNQNTVLDLPLFAKLSLAILKLDKAEAK